ncbi:MAG: hypothetical protein LBN35_00010 [Clostridiales Family XIII bacterium]|jgi:hypothetical protein|nr:hypothetical protein [Clostridiales Family XIII bacterium]
MEKLYPGIAAPRKMRLMRAICTALITTLFIGLTAAALPQEDTFAASASSGSSGYKVSGGFKYEIKGGKAYIVGYTGREQSVSVPKKIGKKTVVYVELCGFEGSAIDFSKCTGLKTFYAEQLYISKLDLRANRALKTLTLDESGGMTSLDLSKNTKLKVCYIYSDSIKSLNISGNKAMKKLTLFHCPITKLDLKACKSLTDLTVCNTKLTSLSLEKNRSLKRVTLQENKLKTINIGKNKKLKGLKFS